MADTPTVTDLSDLRLGANRRERAAVDPDIPGDRLAGEPPPTDDDRDRDDPPRRSRRSSSRRSTKRSTTTGDRVKATIGAGSSTTKRMTQTQRAQLAAPLNSIWVGVGGITLAFDPFCGHVLIERGPAVTDALLDVAETNPKVRQALEQFATVSGWGAIFAAVSGVALPILAHHSGMIPPQLGRMLADGAVPDQILDQTFPHDAHDDDDPADRVG